MMEVKMVNSEIKVGNCKAIAYRLRQGQDNGGIDREGLALFLEGVGEYIEAVDKLVEHLRGNGTGHMNKGRDYNNALDAKDGE